MIRICIIGPDSTGKSTLCKQLSERYGYRWEKEYAREYIERLDRHYTLSDLHNISRQIIKQISKNYKEEVVLFDTELIIMKVWYLHVYKAVPDNVLEAIKAYPMDMYLILTPDISIEPDPVRENLDKRDYFFEWYIKEAMQTQRPYRIISGQGESRTQAAYDAINTFIRQ